MFETDIKAIKEKSQTIYELPHVLELSEPDPNFNNFKFDSR
jgi:hypothetical protein